MKLSALSKPAVAWSFVSLACALVFVASLLIFGPQQVLAFLVHPATAAWIQALGSIGAIGIAIWIAGGSERSTKQHAILHAKLFARAAEAAVGGLHTVMSHSQAQKSRFMGELHEVALVGQSIPLALLPGHLVEPIFEMRSLVGRCLSLGRENVSHDASDGRQLVGASYQRCQALNLIIQGQQSVATRD